MLVWQVEEDYEAVVESVRERLIAYVPVQEGANGGSGYPAEVVRRFPYVWPGPWPLLSVKELPPIMGKPESVSDSDCLIQALRFAVYIYYPSLTRPDLGKDYVDGREAADRITTAVWSRFIKALQDDTGLFSLVARVEFSLDANDQDALGASYFASDQDDNTIMWIRATEASFYL